VPRFKQRFSFIRVAPGDIYSTLDTLKVADTVLLLETAHNWEDGLCAEGELLLTSILAQGLPASVVALTDLEQLPQKVSHPPFDCLAIILYILPRKRHFYFRFQKQGWNRFATVLSPMIVLNKYHFCQSSFFIQSEAS